MAIATLLSPITKSKNNVFTIPVDPKTGSILQPVIYKPNAPKTKPLEAGDDAPVDKRGVGFLVFSTIMALCAVGFFVGAVVCVFKDRETAPIPLVLEGKAGNRTIYIGMPEDAKWNALSQQIKIVKENGELEDPKPEDYFRREALVDIRPPYFDYSYLVDCNDKWLLLDMPAVPILQVDHPAKVFNDFTGNWTVVMDVTEGSCYVMPMHPNISKSDEGLHNGQCRCRLNLVTGKEYCSMDLTDASTDSYYRFGPFDGARLFHGSTVEAFCVDRPMYFLLSTDILDTSGPLIPTDQVLRFVDFAAGHLRLIQILRSS